MKTSVNLGHSCQVTLLEIMSIYIFMNSIHEDFFLVPSLVLNITFFIPLVIFFSLYINRLPNETDAVYYIFIDYLYFFLDLLSYYIIFLSL